MIEINDLVITLNKKCILNKVSLFIEKNKIIGLVAPNGTGKTTFLKTISGLILPNEGEIKINQADFHTNRSAYLSQLLFIESSAFLYSDITVLDHLKYVKNIWKSSIDVNQVIEDLNMNTYKKLPVKKLSLGMKQHVLIAMYVVSDASVLLLDEPMNGLDPTSLDLVSKLLVRLKQEGKIIVFSSHNLSNITEVCDEIMFMNEQNIEVVTKGSEDNIKELYEEYYVSGGGKLDESNKV